MSRPRSAGSVFWGLILISAGAIFLLKNLGYDVPIWSGIARYWPVLLIVWGLIKLVDYVRWKRAGEPGPLFGAGEVVLLIVVILAGTALTAAANLSPDFGYLLDMANIDLWDITGNSYQFSEHYEKDVPAGSRIEVINRYGNVDVTPSDSDRIVVDVAKTVIAANEQQADDLSDVLMYSIAEEGNRYRIISNFNRDQNTVRGRRFKTSLTIKVPQRSALTVDNRFGNVALSEITGDQNVTNTFGKVTMSGIAGGIKVDNRNDSVMVEDIMGDAVITSQYGNIEVRNVTGALEVRNRNGSIRVQEVRGDARLSNSFASVVSASDVGGTLTIDARNSAVEVKRVEGDATVRNQFQSVRVDDVQGRVDIDNRNGRVELRYAQPPRQNVQVQSRYGDVILILPGASSFVLDARTRYGSVSSDFPDLTRQSNFERRSLTGSVGAGGPNIRIDNQNGDIHIEK